MSAHYYGPWPGLWFERIRWLRCLSNLIFFLKKSKKIWIVTKNEWVTLLLLGHEKSTQHLEKTSLNCLLLLQFSPFWQRHTSDCLTEGRSAPPDWDHPLVSGGERGGKKSKDFVIRIEFSRAPPRVTWVALKITLSCLLLPQCRKEEKNHIF